jgi:hypothetical protein
MSELPATDEARQGSPSGPGGDETRRFVFPEPGDTLATLAARLLPDVAHGEQLLQSWNLHLVMRPFPVGEPGEVLTTDIVYLEPPPAA